MASTNEEEEVKGAEEKAEEKLDDSKEEDEKKKKKKKAGEKDGEEEKEEKDAPSSQEQLLQMLRPTRVCEESRRQAGERPHLFWDTQPVPSMGSENFQAADSGPIDPIKTPEDVRDQPYALPDAFEWSSCDVMHDEEIMEIYTLLNENYVEDDD